MGESGYAMFEILQFHLEEQRVHFQNYAIKSYLLRPGIVVFPFGVNDHSVQNRKSDTVYWQDNDTPFNGGIHYLNLNSDFLEVITSIRASQIIIIVLGFRSTVFPNKPTKLLPVFLRESIFDTQDNGSLLHRSIGLGIIIHPATYNSYVVGIISVIIYPVPHSTHLAKLQDPKIMQSYRQNGFFRWAASKQYSTQSSR